MEVKHIQNIHEDDRGLIAEVVPSGVSIQSVLYITGTPGAVRGQHWHKKDTHYCLVLGGKIKYTEKLREKGAKEESVVLESGDVVFSDVNKLHKFEFLTEGIFIAFATMARTQKSYESDTTRENF